MPGTLIDTCVLLDLITNDPVWLPWSAETLSHAADLGPLVINPIIYSEVSFGFERIEEVDAAVSPASFEYRPIPREAAFLASRAFRRYRQAGGSRNQMLPDFLIGAHASVESLPLITRDPRRFATYFPRLKIIGPR